MQTIVFIYIKKNKNRIKSFLEENRKWIVHIAVFCAHRDK